MEDMTQLSAILMLGFALGVRHAADADHVIAVSTIVTRGRSAGAAMVVGALWGIGHLLTVAAVGAAIILFNVTISPRVGLSMELSVGVMLVVLGLSNLTGVTQYLTMALTPGAPAAIHSHPHSHGDYVHSHPHGHQPEFHGHREDQTPAARLDRMLNGIGAYQTLRPLFVGIVHGLAGSAAIALMILATIRDPFWAVAYLLVFGLGTIAGMMLITIAIATPLAFADRQFAGINRYLAWSSGLLSLAFGIFVVYHVGVVDGLFARHPNWVPR
jgi:high-affinity nickel-transport protein